MDLGAAGEACGMTDLSTANEGFSNSAVAAAHAYIKSSVDALYCGDVKPYSS